MVSVYRPKVCGVDGCWDSPLSVEKSVVRQSVNLRIKAYFSHKKYLTKGSMLIIEVKDGCGG